jgi:hypothetical protein
MANPLIPQEDIVNRINRTTGVTGGRQYSTPLPANKIPKQPGTSLVPAGQRVSSGPDARVTKDFFRQPAQPNNSFYGADASYDGPVQQGRNLSTNLKPKIDPYTGQPVKPAFQGVRNFAGKVGNTVGNAVKGLVTDPVSLYGMADSVNQSALESNMQKGNLGLKDIPRMALSAASRFPQMVANRLAPIDNSQGSDTVDSPVQTVTGSIAPQTKPVQGNIVGNVNIPDSTINPVFQQRSLAPDAYQNTVDSGTIPANNQATQRQIQQRRSLAPVGDNTGVFMGDFKLAKGKDANGRTNWEQQPQRVLTVNDEFQDMSDPASQTALAQSDANFARSAPRYNNGGQGGSGVGPVTQVYRGSERTDYAFDENGDPYVVPQKNSELDLKMKDAQASQSLVAQKAQRDYEMDQKKLGLEERRLNASLQPRPVAPDYAPIYDETADSMGGTTKRLAGGYDKTTGQFKPVDNGGQTREFKALFDKYQKALSAGMPKEQADAELLRLMGN